MRSFKLHLTTICIFVLMSFEIFGDQSKTIEVEAVVETGLREGDCSKAVLSDMVFQDHIRKPTIPLISRNASVTWHGDAKIYCIIAEPEKEQTPGSNVIVKDGGVNHTFVNLEIHSKKGEGLDYAVQIFGIKVR
ncbi:uncharacterized protein LOC126890604 [Diabrotica virgifera virgifera]|uniref:Uncharacterized protein LOC114333754 n=1 Tax=Diabrotica virgifera virgifera TaxID=50390 RepID=A0A6P7G3F0_DIAVI|nr:uncharacterized protein LOC126890604 [Diabrotica virgifera virgifera]